MPSALSVPICEFASCNGACITWTSVVRNAKQPTIAISSVIAIFTMVHRRCSRCSRNGFEVSFSDGSRNLNRLRSAIGVGNRLFAARVEGDQSAGRQSGANAQRIGVPDFVIGNHPPNIRNLEGATIQNRLGLFLLVAFRTAFHRTGQEEVPELVRESRRRAIAAEFD